MSLMVKASPTVQRLIRSAGLEAWPITATGPKGLVTEEDVAAARTAKETSESAAQSPVTIELAPLVTHMMDSATLPTSAVTNKAELMKYYETMCAAHPAAQQRQSHGSWPFTRAYPWERGRAVARKSCPWERGCTVARRARPARCTSILCCLDPRLSYCSFSYRRYTMRRMEIAADVLYKGKFVKGFCHLYDGQEAIGMGIESAVTYNDSIVTSYRDHTYQFTRGDKIENVLGELLGR